MHTMRVGPSTWRSHCLEKTETDFHLCADRHRHSVAHRGLEPPRAKVFSGLIVESEPQGPDHGKRGNIALSVDHNPEDCDSSTELGRARFFSIRRLRLVERLRRQHIRADSLYFLQVVFILNTIAVLLTGGTH